MSSCGWRAITSLTHHFCLVRRANEKGHIESLVGYSRRNFLVPVPNLDDFELYNEGLVEDCRRELQRKVRGKSGTKAELLAEDCQAMLPLAAAALRGASRGDLSGQFPVIGPL